MLPAPPTIATLICSRAFHTNGMSKSWLVAWSVISLWKELCGAIASRLSYVAERERFSTEIWKRWRRFHEEGRLGKGALSGWSDAVQRGWERAVLVKPGRAKGREADCSNFGRTALSKCLHLPPFIVLCLCHIFICVTMSCLVRGDGEQCIRAWGVGVRESSQHPGCLV